MAENPHSWAGLLDTNVFSFAFGTYYGLGPSLLSHDSDNVADSGNGSSCRGQGFGDSSDGLDGSERSSTTSDTDGTLTTCAVARRLLYMGPMQSVQR